MKTETRSEEEKEHVPHSKCSGTLVTRDRSSISGELEQELHKLYGDNGYETHQVCDPLLLFKSTKETQI